MRTAALLRFIHVVGVLRRHQVDKTLGLGYGRYAFAFLRGINPLLWRNPHKGLARGALLRLALESLGPIYIKFGQVLSTRQDLLPEDIAEELALLQDKVAPFPGNEAEAIVVEALGVPIAQSFQHFERACLASASVAQVHAAQLLSGESVVVKVIRPGIAKQIKRDLDLLHFMAGVFLRMAKDAERYRPHALIDAFAEHLSLELDLSQLLKMVLNIMICFWLAEKHLQIILLEVKEELQMECRFTFALLLNQLQPLQKFKIQLTPI